MSISKEQISGVLKNINHPGSGKDIISLGMVRNINIEGSGISFEIKTARRRDPFAKAVVRASEKALKSSFGDSLDVEIKLVTEESEEVKEKNSLSKVRNFIAIASGKGGVGKSTIAVNLAVTLAGMGYGVGLVDADIFGPSVPNMMGALDARPKLKEDNGRQVILPEVKYGVKFLSIGLFVSADNALIWRGPMATGALRQLINDADWGELDYLIFDLPPGTSDIHLTLVQEVAVTGAIIVSTPQEVAIADAIKGVAMFRSEDINVPVIGIVENMAWFTPAELPENRYYIFGRDGCKRLAEKLGLSVLAEIPIVQGIREGGDQGVPVAIGGDVISGAFREFAVKFVEAVDNRNERLPPTSRVQVKTR